MPFHVEIRETSLRHARAFNLDEEELRRSILEPWTTNRVIELGDHEWAPRESTLKVLEGPHLEPPELSFGQGWSNAERSARDVTGDVLAVAERSAPPPAEAVAVEADSVEEAIAALAAGRETRPIELGAAQAAIDRRDPEVAAIILVTRTQTRPASEQRQS